MINELIKNRNKGQIYNLLTKHSNKLNLRMDDGHRYDLAGDIINTPKKYKQIISKLKEYEDDKNLYFRISRRKGLCRQTRNLKRDNVQDQLLWRYCKQNSKKND